MAGGVKTEVMTEDNITCSEREAMLRPGLGEGKDAQVRQPFPAMLTTCVKVRGLTRMALS